MLFGLDNHTPLVYRCFIEISIQIKATYLLTMLILLSHVNRFSKRNKKTRDPHLYERG